MATLQRGLDRSVWSAPSTLLYFRFVLSSVIGELTKRRHSNVNGVNKRSVSQDGPGKDTVETTTLILLNRSNEPVYEVVATLVFVQGGGPRRGEDYGPRNYQFVSVMSVLPPGRWHIDVRGNWHGMMRRPGVEIAFIDRAGTTWIRRAAGVLEEIKLSPIDHYQLSRPLDMCVPESDEG